MVSNQILQNTIDGFKEITGTDVCICDTDGKILASTIGGFEADERAVVAFARSQADSQTAGGCWFFKVFDEREPEYVVISAGVDNRYGHPHAETLQRLDDAGCTVCSTQDNGAVMIRSDGRNMTIHGYQ